MLLFGMGLIAVGLLLFIVPAVGFFIGPAVVAAGVILLVLHFTRVSRGARTP